MICLVADITNLDSKADPLHANVRFGSKADICSATADVRFTLNSDRESGFPQKAMSALPPKADMCGALGHVRLSANSGHRNKNPSTLAGALFSRKSSDASH